MAMLAGTASGLLDVESGDVVAFEGRDVTAISGEWGLLDGREVVGPGWEAGDGGGRLLEGPAATCIAALAGGGALVGTAEAHLYLLRQGAEAERVESFDQAPGRVEWYTPWGGPPDVRSMAVSPGGAVLVNVHVGGILRSQDTGGSWQPTIDLEEDVHQVLTPSEGVALAACANGLAVSADDGLTWTVEQAGLQGSYARAVAVSGGSVLLSASTGFQGRQSGVYRKPLSAAGSATAGDEQPFERCRSGLPEWLAGNVDSGWLVGATDGTAAFATPEGEVYASADEGRTWRRVVAGLPPVRFLLMA